MDKLIAQLLRLYIPAGTLAPELLARHARGELTLPVDLFDAAGTTRAIVIPFDRHQGDEDGAHWTRLCELARFLQVDCGFPAPAVSISSAFGFRLWLSLAAPVPAQQARRFLELLRERACPELDVAAALRQPVELPPCRNEATGRWAAFINPGMGASFVDEPGLEMAPPAVAQAAFLEGLETISPAQFDAALATLAPATQSPAVVAPAPASPLPPNADTLLLRDATLEDIVRHLHARGIEPTFRHVLSGR